MIHQHPNRNHHGRALLLPGMWLGLVATCFAGPPLSIDDPGILDRGAWEIILASAGEDYDWGSLFEAPLLELSLGLTANTQVSLALPYQAISPEAGSESAGLGMATIGYKWRFHADGAWQWAFAPNYSQPVTHELITRDGPDDLSMLGLPLLVSREAGDFTVLGQATWNLDSRGTSHWDYGLALTRPLAASVEAMLEVSGRAETSLTHPTLGYQLGLDFRIRPGLHLLGSVGKDIRSHPDPDARLNYRYYLGLRWMP